MSLPTVAQLCRVLPDDLQPAPGVVPPEAEISAVHVSELADPTPYLSGGELLLTTGLSLPDNDLGLRRYVGQLSTAGLAALGLGLGPHLQEVPAGLVAACEQTGLCLLTVPPASAFLTISKEYWASRSRSSRQQLSDTLTAHGELVTAMLSPDPTGAALRALSVAVGAWTTLFDEEARVQQVFPAGRAHDAVELGRRIVESRAAGTTTIVSVPLRDETTLVLPLVVDGRIRGHLALGSTEPISPTARRLAITTTALLSIDSVQRHRADAALLARLTAVATLLDLGHVESARRLSTRLETPAVPDSVRVLQVRTVTEADAIEAVLRWCPAAWPGPRDPSPGGDRWREPWFVMPATVRELHDLRSRLERADPRASVVLSGTVPADSVHEVRMGLADRLASLPHGTYDAPARPDSSEAVWREGLDAVMAYSRTDLTSTLAAYLRHRGGWDAASRDLGIHRNTLTYRMARISTLLGCDVDDPDVASQIWLHLRDTGRA